MGWERTGQRCRRLWSRRWLYTSWWSGLDISVLDVISTPARNCNALAHSRSQSLTRRRGRGRGGVFAPISSRRSTAKPAVGKRAESPSLPRGNSNQHVARTVGSRSTHEEQSCSRDNNGTTTAIASPRYFIPSTAQGSRTGQNRRT